MTPNKPTHEMRMGKVKAAIWANATERGTQYSITFSRLYKKAEKWERTESFGRDDLPLLVKVAELAHDWIYAQPHHLPLP